MRSFPLVPVLAAALLSGACAHGRSEAAAAGQDALAEGLAPALAAPCGIPSTPGSDWRAVQRPDGLRFRVPPRFAAAPAEPQRSSYGTLEAELNVWTGGKWTFPLRTPGRSNRCSATVDGRVVDIQVVQLDEQDGTLPPGLVRGVPASARRPTTSGAWSIEAPHPRLPVYIATAIWQDRLDGRFVYAQLRSPLRRDMEYFPTLVSTVGFEAER
ncbi:MAG TPA: hypothetical protein VKA84_19810 [Gemmatimonadaceae bacterium]|nr:hypothetical protein [Gemmatimonadaceae bacterium]